jgi:hypothetical protein
VKLTPEPEGTPDVGAVTGVVATVGLVPAEVPAEGVEEAPLVPDEPVAPDAVELAVVVAEVVAVLEGDAVFEELAEVAVADGAAVVVATAGLPEVPPQAASAPRQADPVRPRNAAKTTWRSNIRKLLGMGDLRNAEAWIIGRQYPALQSVAIRLHRATPPRDVAAAAKCVTVRISGR